MNLKSLFAKLNDVTREAMEEALGLCLARRQYEAHIEHWLYTLLGREDSDLVHVMQHCGVSLDALAHELDDNIETFRTGNANAPSLSPMIVTLIEKAWVIASIEQEVAAVRSGHLLLALLDDRQLRRDLVRRVPSLDELSADALRHEFSAATEGSAENGVAPFSVAVAADGSESAPRRGNGKTPALDQFTIDLTERARAGHIDPVLGREQEVRQMVDVLTRRRQNNPILTGEAGVGKTAVVEGLALRIVNGDVPRPLQNVELRTLDLGLLQAGAGVKGEFEERLKNVIEETKRSLHPIILFIDEAHTLIGSGNKEGQGDAANLLKPALARGELRTIAATTWAEYKKYFEKDAALARRFQVIKVDEPTEEVAIDMLRGLIGRMRDHHKVEILDEAIEQAVRLSHRYITGRQLPDKAVSVLDTACARVALGQSAQPGALEDARRRLDNLDTERQQLEYEQARGAHHDARLAELAEIRAGVQQQVEVLNARWQAQCEAVERWNELNQRLNALDAQDNGRDELMAELGQAREALETIQERDPLVHAHVDGNTVGAVISAWTGIPLGKMVRDEMSTVQQLPSLLGERVIGQDHALAEIGKRIAISRAKLEDPNKPIGVFLLLGPSGVGKTETALSLADTLYGGERNVITINMSEYQEAHTVSSLKGAPPGYVGYGEGGVLTEAVRRKPYSVVLLDEVEKAHPDVLELFFQVFDKGVMDDGEGREINFRNTVIILTSNVGTDHMMKRCLNVDTLPVPQSLVDEMRPLLNDVFKPAFLGRLNIVPYFPIQKDVLRNIVALKLERLRKRVKRNHNAAFHYAPELVDFIAERCVTADSGARDIDNFMTGHLMPELAEHVLARMADDTPIEQLVIGVNEEEGTLDYQLS
ncbi:type VI secretion system ATPase TssH [Zymobacter palmae]|uniref:ATPase with chaperone activity, ATP-binding n=1 Tax=Zymobacter palmae TaxID=33074 RepID=A0A348HH30_9GAMM|nr:type VI secretion system ATPase TssH [Zymobacter palmae]BBG30932.1 ATPase with chaperone activity, ATP-binding [Zymobacter palmae]